MVSITINIVENWELGYNKVGQGKYSANEIPQPYIDDDTRQIDLLGEYTLFGDPVGMFEIKFPDNDIRVRVK